MIKAIIQVSSRSSTYVYVRDEVNDTAGKEKQFYAYRGNARRKVNFTKHIPFQYSIAGEKESTNLEKNVNYTFSVNVNGNGAQEFTVSFPREKFSNAVFTNAKEFVSYDELFHKLNSLSDDFYLEYIWRKNGFGLEEGLYFVSNITEAASSIEITDGDLFSNIQHFDSFSDEIASDNYFDQTDAGQIKEDYDTLKSNLDSDDMYLEFPESTPTTELIRENREYPNTSAMVINTVPRGQVDTLRIAEVYVNSIDQAISY